MEDIREAAENFEATLVSLVKDKNGFVLKMGVHPNDIPEGVLRDWVGTRYMVVLVRLNDENEPSAPQHSEEGRAAVKLAAALCGDEGFQSYMAAQGLADAPNEEATVIGLRAYLGIKSRAELKVNVDARRKLDLLRRDFADSFRR